MKKDLRSKAFGAKEFNGKSEQEVLKDIDKDKMNDVKKFYSQYAGKDEKELKSTLFDMAKKGREDGSLSDKEIDAMAQKLSPMLDSKKREKLNSLIAMMKNNQY